MKESFKIKVKVDISASESQAKSLGLIEENEIFDEAFGENDIEYEMIVSTAKWGMDNLYFQIIPQAIYVEVSAFHKDDKAKENEIKRDVSIKLPAIPIQITTDQSGRSLNGLSIFLSELKYSNGDWDVFASLIGV